MVERRRHRFGKGRILWGVAAACGILVALVAPSSAVAFGTWGIVPSANPSGGSSPTLLAVSADSASNAWAVGEFFNATTKHYLTLAERWNGTSWTVTPTPNPSSDEWLNGVASISQANAWAVGFQNNSTWLANRTLIEHWNGSTWSTVPSPNPSTGYDDLWSVYATSASNVWAVGRASTSSGEKTLAVHYNGTSWSVVPTPNATSYNDFHRVFGSSASDVWAVGTAYDSSGANVDAPLIEHWNGSAWKIVPSPVLGDSYLRGGWATGPSDAWIVGEWDGPAPAYTPHVLLYHWNGTSWKSVTAPTGTGYEFTGITANSPSNAWLSGTRLSSNGSTTLTLIEHWNGTSWSVVSSPNRITTGSGINELNAITMLPTGLVWAVGDATSGGTLIERNLQG